ncbi:MAG: hypothetical protein WBA76_05935 [Phormidesmis sp.]
MSDTFSFVVKVILLSALLSVVIKYGGPLLPIAAPFTERLNPLVTAIVTLPSVIIGIALWTLSKK